MKRGMLIDAYYAFCLMPLWLKVVTAYCLLSGTGFMIVAIIPLANIAVHGQMISFREFWARGYGPYTLLIGVTLLTIGIMVFRKRMQSGKDDK